MITIQNQEITATVSLQGAELQNLKDIHTNQEYLWQGDARWWNRRSPLLFPIVGGMWDGTCRIQGKEIKIPKHGIMRDRSWQIVSKQSDRVILQYISTVGDFSIFPFAFHLFLEYKIVGRKVMATFKVKNTNGSDLWFQFGGHPAIALPNWKEESEIDGYVRFTGDPHYVLRAREQGCLQSERFPIPTTSDGLTPLCVSTFINEALIFDNHQINAVTVLDRQQNPVATVSSDSPAWLIWSQQGVHTPFVCLEPWYGLPDKENFKGSIEERPYINRLATNQIWEGWLSIELH